MKSFELQIIGIQINFVNKYFLLLSEKLVCLQFIDLVTDCELHQLA